ncbi:MAG: rhodanese-like domain-containing protein [Acidobacteriota bacterium]|nr:rhodanese-like domain-containing protein [Acidobacteriota bacterium]
MNLLHRFGSVLILAMLASVVVRAADVARPVLPSDLVTASQLNSELVAVKSGKIVLIQVGFHVMYQMGHIPNSQYAGPAARADGLAALKKLVAKLPRNQKIVIYCGCCPWDDCPNIRPAYQALKEMGFKNFKVLDIPVRLGDDWTAKGYPVVKGD